MKRMRNMKNQKGFTLVEIAIVLVIIGLLIGGILKGQEMIKSGKTKKIVDVADKIRASYNLYLDKTGVEPGDSDADGLFDDNATFWQDLFDQKITGQSAAVKDPFGGEVTMILNDDSPDADGIANGIYIAFPGVGANTDIATGLDTKYDDGDTTTGAMQIVPGTGFIMPL